MTANNGVKPRYDGGGTEFGLMHRDLGPGYLMFDVDRMSAVMEVNLELKRENQAFIEYRQTDGIRFVAMFEYKHTKTPYSLDAIDSTKSSTMARNEMARLLGCRLFVVYASDGRPPLEFWEYIPDTGEYILAGVLSYTENNRTEQVKEFWNNALGIKR